MVMRAVICKGDPTSHGGEVLEGKESALANGRPIALKGHMTYCPQCKGNYPITEGLPFHSFSGVGTVVEGMKTACGATLIATTTKGFMMIDDRNEADGQAVAAPPQALAPSYSAAFSAVDKETGQPKAGVRYRIELQDGTIIRGATDADGNTQRLSSGDAQTARLVWETDQPGDA
jgi:uncharacterized Zn-binding protein involved in type VI secretion